MDIKPRIYIAIPSFYPLVGGAETQTLAQSQHLCENGYSVQVITFCHKHTWQEKETIKGVPVIRVAKTFLGRRDTLPIPLRKLMYLLAMFVMTWTIWQQRKQFDILQVCQISLLVMPLAIICLLAKKPMAVVAISAGSDKATKTHVAARLIAGPLDPNTPWLQVGERGWVDGDLYNLKRAGKPIVRSTRSLLQSIGAVVIVLSSRMKRYLKENDFDLPGIEIIPNGVDTIRFQPVLAEANDDEHKKTVVCVSKLRYEKGNDVLLQAWRLVHEQQPEARLIIVGAGFLEQQLKRMADALGITESVEFAGLQSDIPGQLHRGSIGVLPSRWEGMPNALLEAMASGLACVATRVSGSEDLIEHGVNGLLVEPVDYEGLAQALLSLLKDPALIEQYGKAARTTIEQHYTLEHVMNMYTQIYQKISSNRGQTMTSDKKNMPSSKSYPLVP